MSSRCQWPLRPWSGRITGSSLAEDPSVNPESLTFDTQASGRLCWQLGTSQSYFERGSPNGENVPTKFAGGKACGAFPWWMIGVGRRRLLWAVPHLCWWSWVLSKQTEGQVTGNKSVSSTLRGLCISSCPQVPALTSLSDEPLPENCNTKTLSSPSDCGYGACSQQQKPEIRESHSPFSFPTSISTRVS